MRDLERRFTSQVGKIGFLRSVDMITGLSKALVVTTGVQHCDLYRWCGIHDDVQTRVKPVGVGVGIGIDVIGFTVQKNHSKQQTQ